MITYSPRDDLRKLIRRHPVQFEADLRELLSSVSTVSKAVHQINRSGRLDSLSELDRLLAEDFLSDPAAIMRVSVELDKSLHHIQTEGTLDVTLPVHDERFMQFARDEMEKANRITGKLLLDIVGHPIHNENDKQGFTPTFADIALVAARTLERTRELRKEEIQTNQIKVDVLVPWFTQRLHEMREDGLPIPDYWFTEQGQALLRDIPFVLNPEYEERENVIGHMSADDAHVWLEQPLDSTPLYPAKLSTPVHEWFHLVSRTATSPFVGSTSGFVTMDTEDYDGRFMLNEATTEVLNRWALSGQRVDFKEMTAHDFFLGPHNIPMGAYAHEQIAMAHTWGDVRAVDIVSAYVADPVRVIDGHEEPAQSAFVVTIFGHDHEIPLEPVDQFIPHTVQSKEYERFEKILQEKVEGGWSGLTEIARHFDHIDFGYPAHHALRSNMMPVEKLTGGVHAVREHKANSEKSHGIFL